MRNKPTVKTSTHTDVANPYRRDSSFTNRETMRHLLREVNWGPISGRWPKLLRREAFYLVFRGAGIFSLGEEITPCLGEVNLFYFQKASLRILKMREAKYGDESSGLHFDHNYSRGWTRTR